MSGLKDFLFGSGSLKKASGEAPAKSAEKSGSYSGNAGLDMAKLAQESADRNKVSATAPPSTKKPQGGLTSTMTPMKKAGK